MSYRPDAGPSRVVAVGRHVYTVYWQSGEQPSAIDLRKYTQDSHEFWHCVWSRDCGRPIGPKLRIVVEVARKKFGYPETSS